MNDCQTCGLRICQLSYSDYLPQKESQYCRPQVLYMLRHSDILDSGRWPEQKSGYIDTHEDVQVSIPQCAPHEGVICEWAEVLWRLDQTGQDGITLREEIESGAQEPLSSAAWRALGYVGCGLERRKESYAHWKDRKYGKKKRINIPFKNNLARVK
jgi:hypothetical protein